MEDIIESIDDSQQLEVVEVKGKSKKTPKLKNSVSDKPTPVSNTTTTEVYNPLKKERVIVRHINKKTGIWGNNPKHVLAGGMAETAIKTYVVPRLSSGMFVNILTDNEKSFLEETMGLEYNALSIYKKQDNFWDDGNDEGISRVKLKKQDNYLDLSNPEDYIRYKILLANKHFIAPSIKHMQDYPKATYEFVIINEGDESKMALNNMNSLMLSYKEFGKIEDNESILKCIIELMENRPISNKTKLDVLKTKVNSLIQSDNKMFLKVVTDPALPTKVLIREAVEAGIVYKRGTFYYLREGNTPLCLPNTDPTLSNAVKFLNLPKNQEIKFTIEAKLNQE